jgi:hypothetical protein
MYRSAVRPPRRPLVPCRSTRVGSPKGGEAGAIIEEDCLRKIEVTVVRELRSVNLVAAQNCLARSTTPCVAVREGEIGCLFDDILYLVEAIERPYMEVSAGPQQGQEPKRRGRSHAFESPMPGECKGEQHVCERGDMHGSPGPQRSRDSVALAARTARPGEENPLLRQVHFLEYCLEARFTV